MDKIEKIRKELRRRIALYSSLSEYTIDPNRIDEDEQLLSFLDTLEEEPDKSLEEEIRRYLREECSSDDEPATSETARHFAQWGAEYAKKDKTSFPNDLEEVAKQFVGYDMDTDDFRDYEIGIQAFIAGAQWQEKRNEETIKTAEDHAFLAGADWQKEQMLKDAVDGEVDFEYFGYKVIRPDLKQLDTLLESMNHGDKVRIIIVKED